MLIDAIDLNTSPPEWLVEGMIPRVGVGFLYGPRYYGKSLLVNGELALAVANGTEFLRRPTIQGTVVLCLGEGLYDAGVRKQARLRREQEDRIQHAAQIAVERGDDAAKAWLDARPRYTDDNLLIWPDPFTLPVTRYGNDGEGDITRSLQRFITSLKKIKNLELVILDSFSDFTGGLSISNDTSANRSVLGLKAMLRELNCCILCVAHPTEKGDKMIGAGRLGNAADFIIKIEPEDTGPGQPRSASILSEKNKYGPLFETTGYTIEGHAWWDYVTDQDDEPTGEIALVKSATVRQHDETPEQPPTMKEFEDGDERLMQGFVELADGRPVKRSTILRRGVGRPQSDNRKHAIELVNASPDGIKVSEIANALDINEATARVILSRAYDSGEVGRIATGVYGPVER